MNQYHYNIIVDYLTNDFTKIKKTEYLNSITFLNNHNYNMKDLKQFIENFLDKTTFYYRIEKDSKLYHDLVRKIIFNNNEEEIIKEFTKNKFSTLFLNRILIPEDYKNFREAFLEYISQGIRFKLDRFKYFEEFVDYHYKNNQLKENNKLISKIIILRDCNYPTEYLQILNKKNLDYTLEAFLLTNKESIIKDEGINFFKYENNLLLVEEIMDNLNFSEVNKLSLTKCLKHHGFSLFTLLLLINCLKKYKIIITDYKIIFGLIDEFTKKNRYQEYHDIYLAKYFEYCIDKKYINADIELLNLCGKSNVKKLFIDLIEIYKVKPNDLTLKEILDNIKSNDCDNLTKLINMKFIVTKEHINIILKKGKLNNKLREVLIKNSFVELNDEIFENYIKYENYRLNDYSVKLDKLNKNLLLLSNYFYEPKVLLDFNLDKTIDYFDIIHKYNSELNYNFFLDFLLQKCNMKKQEIKHILEFSRNKYKFCESKPLLYKLNVDEYIEKSKFKINKYCLDICMKAGNYESGIYLIQKFNLKPDLTTLLFIKDTNNRINFYKLYF